jgi:single-strand DNA-binding protein
MARSLNKVQLIGNLTRDPELRYTPNGNAVCSFSLATNRNWTTDSGEKREEVDFHRIIAWNKLGELCSQFLVKGRKVYVEGRLTTRTWTGQDGAQKSTTEVIINDMILLDRGGASASIGGDTNEDVVPSEGDEVSVEAPKPKKSSKEKTAASGKKDNEESAKSNSDEEVMPDDIPF